MIRQSRRFLIALMVGAFALLGSSMPASAASVTPTLIVGNPSCEGGLKIDPVVSGTYGPVTIVVTGTSFSFSTNGELVSDVIVKGGPNANWYHYDPPVTSDTGLVAPTNKTGGRYGLSHLCFSVDDKKIPDPKK